MQTQQENRPENIVSVMLRGGRVTRGFRDALFDVSNREGKSVNEFVLEAAAEKLMACGRQIPGIFHPGDCGM